MKSEHTINDPSPETPATRKNAEGYSENGIAIGIAIGVAIGATTDNMGLGIALGVAFGAALDRRENSKRVK